MSIIHGPLSARIPQTEIVSEKANQVRIAILNCGLSIREAESWFRHLHTDADAFALIDDCLEGDVDPRVDFNEAWRAFKHQFKNYANYCKELREDYASVYGEDLDP